MWNVPLYMENGPMNKNAFSVARMNNDVVAFDETSGSTIWTKVAFDELTCNRSTRSDIKRCG